MNRTHLNRTHLSVIDFEPPDNLNQRTPAVSLCAVPPAYGVCEAVVGDSMAEETSLETREFTGSHQSSLDCEEVSSQVW